MFAISNSGYLEKKIEAAVVWERDLWIVHYGFYSFLHDNFKRPGYPNNPADRP